MQQATLELCKQIQGAKCAYTQSDEISILVTDYDTVDTMAWFDYNVQKIVSVSASIATGKFNLLRILGLQNYNKIDVDRVNTLSTAYFDSRVFNIPMTDVPNYFLARQRDAVKNSIQMLAQSLYSHKELDGKNQSELQEMCFQKGHNWNDLSCFKKRGTYIDREFSEETGRGTWKISEETPFKFDKQFFNDRAIY
jgi:tRNA(His) 5'-end guanylyltransferase